MGILVEQEEIHMLKMDAPVRQQSLYESLKARTLRNTREDCLVQSSDTQEWYHLCWERLSDAAFICRTEREETLGKWLHHRVMEIVTMDIDQWVGPWYRGRRPEPFGNLETSHLTLAICEAMDLCPFLFDEAEQAVIAEAVEKKGMCLCEKFCEGVVADYTQIQNWFVILLDGFATAAALLQDKTRIQKAIRWGHIAGSIFNQNDYGESLQYANYASNHLAHMNEVLLRAGVGMEELDLKCYSNLMDWYAASYLYRKPLYHTNEEHPRSVNFGDSAAAFRPSGDLLAHVAVRMKKKLPRQAALASWMLDTMYQDPTLGPDELASFGLFNQFQYYTVLLYPKMAAPLDPVHAGLPASMSFEGGQIISRDNWENPQTVVAIQAGYAPYNTTSHRHRDQNSFQLVIGKERMLVDPGHCCYRLNAQKEAVSELVHNTISIWHKDHLIEQKEVDGNVFVKKESKNRLLANYFWKNVQIVISDGSKLYDSPVEKAIRIWVMKLPHMMFVIDVVSASEPVALGTHFSLNNRNGGLSVHRASEQRMVFRKGGQGLKLFEAYSETDGKAVDSTLQFEWSAMHDYYHPLVNQRGQGKEGSLCRYQWKGIEGKAHQRIHSFVMDSQKDIVTWHVYHMEDGYTRMIEPGDDQYLEVKIENGRLLLRNQNGEEHQTCRRGSKLR